MAIQWDAKFSGYKLNLKNERMIANGQPVRCWNRITIFGTNDRSDAVALAVKEASKYGYAEVTIDHITRID